MLNELQYLDENRAWLPHYQQICWIARENAGPQKVAKLPQNRRLNRYRDVLPFDQSRVVLKGGDTDYINANFVEAPDVDRKYVLAQGPLPHTAHHFWQMIWELKTTTIVMLNKIIEKNQIKCHMYWPSEENAVTFGSYRIQFLSDKTNQYYIIRSLEVENLETGESRIVSHYHYTTWPDFGVPSSPSTFLAFLFEIRNAGAFSKDVGPTVIHCSAGIGRSGTLVMVDTVLEMIIKSQDMDSVSISKTLLQLRQYRTGLIQTPDQLRFTYVAIAEAVSILLPDIYKKSIQLLQTREDEEEEPPPIPPRGSRRKLTPEPAAGSGMESEAAKRPKTEQPTDTLREAGVLSSSEGSDEGPDEIIDLSSSDLSSDEQRVTREGAETAEKEAQRGEASVGQVQSVEVDDSEAMSPDAAENEVLGAETAEKEAQRGEASVGIPQGSDEIVEKEVLGPKPAERVVEIAETDKEMEHVERGSQGTEATKFAIHVVGENRGTAITPEESNVENKIDESLGNAVTERTVEIKTEMKSEIMSKGQKNIASCNVASGEEVDLKSQEEFNIKEHKNNDGVASGVETTFDKSVKSVDRDNEKTGTDITSVENVNIGLSGESTKEKTSYSNSFDEEVNESEIVKQSIGESDSSGREMVQHNKSVEQKRETSSLLVSSSEEEVVIGRITVVRSEGNPSFVSEDDNQTNSISSVSENIMNNVHHGHDDDAKSQGSKEKRKEPEMLCSIKEPQKKENIDQENQISSQDKRPSEKETELRKRREDRKQRTSDLIHNIKAKVKQEEQSRQWKGLLKDALVTFTACSAVAIATYYCYRYFTGAT